MIVLNTSRVVVWFTYSLTRLSNKPGIEKFIDFGLIHLFTYKTLKPISAVITAVLCLIHLFTYKTLKHILTDARIESGLIHLFTYKTLKPVMVKCSGCCRLIHLFTYKTLKPAAYEFD